MFHHIDWLIIADFPEERTASLFRMKQSDNWSQDFTALLHATLYNSLAFILTNLFYALKHLDEADSLWRRANALPSFPNPVWSDQMKGFEIGGTCSIRVYTIWFWIHEDKGSFERIRHAWEVSWRMLWLAFSWFQGSIHWQAAVNARSADKPSGSMKFG
jgi:hypothetical protein